MKNVSHTYEQTEKQIINQFIDCHLQAFHACLSIIHFEMQYSVITLSVEIIFFIMLTFFITLRYVK